jgi:hypothetical protein
MADLPNRRAVRTLEWSKGHLGLYDQALNYWEIHPWCVALMWALISRTTYRLDLCVTTRGPGFALAVAKRIEQENWPVSQVYCMEAHTLGRTLARAPDVHRVYYGLEHMRWAFGPNGYFIGPDVPVGVF